MEEEKGCAFGVEGFYVDLGGGGDAEVSEGLVDFVGGEEVYCYYNYYHMGY